MKRKTKKILLYSGIGVGIIAIGLFVALVVLKPKEYNISFNTNGGNKISAQVIKENTLVTRPEDPTKENYEFMGWYFNGAPFSFDTKITKDMVLNAKWSEISKTLDLNTQNLTLKVGDEATLVASIDSDVSWSSSDEAVATISDKGVIKTLKAGEVTITATTKDGQKATCKIVITEGNGDEIAVQNITISGPTKVDVGKTIKFTANISPKNATNKNVTWSSSNKSVATIDASGTVKGLKEGVTVISATTENGKTASMKIIVLASSTSTETPEDNKTPEDVTPTTPVEPDVDNPEETNPGEEEGEEKEITLKITADKQEVKSGETVKLTLTIEPTDATYKTIEWSSTSKNLTFDNTNKLEVNATISNEALDGTITITAKIDNEKSATYTINIKNDYVVTLTAQKLLDVVTLYKYEVSKNGEGFTSYTKFVLDNKVEVSKDQGSILAEDGGNHTTAKITLSNGTTANASVKYN